MEFNKNRLSFVHDPHLYSEFSEIKAAVDDKSTIDRPALYGEPLVFKYGEDENNPHIVLAIGAVGDGVNAKNTNKYFFIDFDAVKESIENIKEELQDTKDELQGSTEELESEIENITTILTSLIEACGVDEETGAYVPNSEDDYLKEAVSLADADNKLSEAIQELRDAYALSTKDTATIKFFKNTEEGTEISAEVKVPEKGLIDGTELENQIIVVEDTEERTGIFHNINVGYDKDENVLTFEVNGEVKGEYEISEGTFIESGEYDAEREMLVFHYNNLEMEDLEIDVRTIINEWNTPEDGQEANGVILTRTTNTERDERGHWQDILSAKICLSEKEGNLLTLEKDGVYASNKAEDIFLANGDSVQDAIDDIVAASISSEDGNIIVKKAEDGGLYANVELSYNNTSNTLTLTKSGQEPTKIELNNFAFVEEVYYDSTKEELVIKYKSNENSNIRETRIPVGDLFSEYEGVVGTHTVDVVFGDHIVNGKTQVYADVRIVDNDTFENNILTTTTQNRLYVKGTADNIKCKDGETVEKTIEDIKNAASSDKVELEGKITAEVERATAKEGELDAAIAKEVTDRTEAVKAEKERAEGAEGVLQSAIEAEETRAMAKEGDLEQAISDEATAREEAIETEKTRAEGAEKAIDDKLTSLIKAVGANDNGTYADYTNKDGNTGASYLTGDSVREDLLLLANTVYDHIGDGDNSVNALRTDLDELSGKTEDFITKTESFESELAKTVGANADGTPSTLPNDGNRKYTEGQVAREDICALDMQLQTTQSGLEAEITRAEGVEQGLNTRLTTAEENIANNTTAIGTLQNDVQALTSNVNGHIQENITKFGELDAKDAELTEGLGEVKTTADNNKSVLDALNTTLGTENGNMPAYDGTTFIKNGQTVREDLIALDSALAELNTSKVVTVEVNNTPEDSTVLREYIVKQGNEQVGERIAIPKDSFLEKVTKTAEDEITFTFIKADGSSEETVIKFSSIVLETEWGKGLKLETETGVVNVVLSNAEKSEEYLYFDRDGKSIRFNGEKVASEIEAAYNKHKDEVEAEFGEVSDRIKAVEDRVGVNEGKIANDEAIMTKLLGELGANEDGSITAYDPQEVTYLKNSTSVREDLMALDKAIATEKSATTSAIAEAVKTETDRATAKENELSAAIEAEASARQEADTTLDGKISAEATAREEAIETEKTRAEGAEKAIDDKIEEEVKRAKGEEATLGTAIETEKTRAEKAEGDLQKAIEDETTAREAADVILEGKISAEATRAKDVEAEIIKSVGLNSDGKLKAYNNSVQYVDSNNDIFTNVGVLDSKLGELSGKTDAAITNAQVRVVEKTSDLAETVAKAYEVFQGETSKGLIEIPKDQHLVDVTASEDNQKLSFTYQFADGTEKTVEVDFTKMIIESEIGKGLIVTDGAVNVNLSTTNDTDDDTKKHLSFTDGGALRLTGITKAISDATSDVETKLNAEIDKEVQRATEAEASISTAVNNEQTRAEGKEAELKALIDTNTSNIGSTSDLLGKVISSLGFDAETGNDKPYDNEIYIVEGATMHSNIATLDKKLGELNGTTETNSSAISKLSEDLAKEIQDRASADNTLQGKIDEEAKTREEEDKKLEGRIAANEEEISNLETSKADKSDVDASIRELEGKIQEVSGNIPAVPSYTIAKTAPSSDNVRDEYVLQANGVTVEGETIKVYKDENVNNWFKLTSGELDEAKKLRLTQVSETEASSEVVVDLTALALTSEVETKISTSEGTIATEINNVKAQVESNKTNIEANTTAISTLDEKLTTEIASAKADCDAKAESIKQELRGSDTSGVETIFGLKKYVDDTIALNTVKGVTDNAVRVNGTEVSLGIDANDEGYLSQTSNGLKVTGINAKFTEVEGKINDIKKYTFESTASVDYESGSSDTVIKPVVKVSAESNNLLKPLADGLYVTSTATYNGATNVLTINGQEIQLNSGSLIKDAYYSDGNLVITFTTADGQEDSVSVPVADLFTPVTAQGGAGIDLTIQGEATVKATLVKDPRTTNMLEIGVDGLYVDRTPIESINNEITTIKGDVNQAKNDIATITNDVNQAKNDIATNKGNITTLQASVSTLENKATALETTQNGLISRVDGHDGQISSITNDITALQTKDAEIEGKINGLETRTTSLEKAINGGEGLDGLIAITSKQQTEIEKLKAGLTANEGSISSAQEALNAAKSDLEAKITAERERAMGVEATKADKSEVSNIETKLTSEASERAQEDAKLQTAIDNLKTTVDNMTDGSSSTSLASKVTALENENKELRERLVALETAIQQFTTINNSITTINETLSGITEQMDNLFDDGTY